MIDNGHRLVDRSNYAYYHISLNPPPFVDGYVLQAELYQLVYIEDGVTFELMDGGGNLRRDVQCKTRPNFAQTLQAAYNSDESSTYVYVLSARMTGKQEEPIEEFIYWISTGQKLPLL